MKGLQFLFAVVGISFSVAVSAPVYGQIRGTGSPSGSYYGSRRPSTWSARPAVSPWLDLFWQSRAPLGNYLQIVRPREQALRRLHTQSLELGRQQVMIQSLGQQVSTLQREGPAGPTGIGGGFMNYSHYYPSLGQVPRRR